MQGIDSSMASQFREIQAKHVNDYRKNKKPVNNAILASIITTDAVIAASEAKGATIAGKLATGATRLGSWGTFFGTVLAHQAVKNTALKHSEGYRKFDKESPIISSLADIGVVLGTAFWVVPKGIEKGKKIISEKFPKFAAKVKDKLDNLSNNINNSSAAKKLTEKAANFATKHPKMTKTLGTLKRFALPVLAIGYVLKVVSDKNKVVSNIQNDCNALIYEKLSKELNEKQSQPAFITIIHDPKKDKEKEISKEAPSPKTDDASGDDIIDVEYSISE